jgi:hypothetical protein
MQVQLATGLQMRFKMLSWREGRKTKLLFASGSLEMMEDGLPLCLGCRSVSGGLWCFVSSSYLLRWGLPREWEVCNYRVFVELQFKERPIINLLLFLRPQGTLALLSAQSRECLGLWGYAPFKADQGVLSAHCGNSSWPDLQGWLWSVGMTLRFPQTTFYSGGPKGNMPRMSGFLSYLPALSVHQIVTGVPASKNQ